MRRTPHNLQAGQADAHGSVVIGAWTAPDLLGQVFKAFAAPEDINPRGAEKRHLPRTFNEAAAACGALRGWHGYDGLEISDEKELKRLLLTGKYAGQWILPPVELLDGRRADGSALRQEGLHLFPVNDLRKFLNAGQLISGLAGGEKTWYGSLSRAPEYMDAYWVVNLETGARDTSYATVGLSRYRPVRLEPLK